MPTAVPRRVAATRVLYSPAMPSPLWEALHTLSALTPPVFLMGGCAEELLLGDDLDRPHKDLDLLAWLGELEQLLEQLAARHLDSLEVVLADAASQPLLVRGRLGGLEIEIYVARPEPDGFSFEVPAQGPAGRLRLFLPVDTFTYPATVRAGLALRTVSPLALAHMRAASARTRHAGDKQAHDLAMLARLRQTFLADYSAQHLQPRIEPV
jgi:hypothetical protein